MRARLLPLRDVDERLLQQWKELAQHCLEPNPSFEPEMILNAAALPEAPDVALVLVHDRDRLHLVAPVARARRYRRVPVPVLTTPHHDYSLLGTPLVSPARPADALGAAVRLLIHDRVAPWWVLEGMSVDGPVADALHEALHREGTRATPFLAHTRAAVLQRTDGDHLDGRISGKSLKSLRRRRRRLSESLDADVRTIDVAGLDLDAAVEGFLHTEAAGWKGNDGGAFLSRPGHGDFFRAVCRDFAAAGRLQIFTLGTPSTSVAYQVNLIAQDRVFNFKIAYDDDYRRFSAGVLLDLDTLEEFHRQDRLASIDSCASPENEVVNQLFPDSLAIASLLVPLTGLRGRVAARSTPVVTAAGRRAREWWTTRREESAWAGKKHL